jgi:hypothetical protein
VLGILFSAIDSSRNQTVILVVMPDPKAYHVFSHLKGQSAVVEAHSGGVDVCGYILDMQRWVPWIGLQ